MGILEDIPYLNISNWISEECSTWVSSCNIIEDLKTNPFADPSFKVALHNQKSKLT